MNKFIYISATDTNTKTSQVYSGYYYINPFDNSFDYYYSTTDGGPFSLGDKKYTNTIGGYTFDSDYYIKRRTSYLTISDTYSEFFNFVFSFDFIL